MDEVFQINQPGDAASTRPPIARSNGAPGLAIQELEEANDAGGGLPGRPADAWSTSTATPACPTRPST